MTLQRESGAPFFRTVCIRCAAAADFFCHCQHLCCSRYNAPDAVELCRCLRYWWRRTCAGMEVTKGGQPHGGYIQ